MRGPIKAVAILGLLSSSCGDTDVAACQRLLDQNTEMFGRGEVVARFKDSIQTEADATRVLQEASFRVILFYSDSVPLLGLVSVPAGGECLAIERLRGHSAIDDAYPQVIVHAQ